MNGGEVHYVNGRPWCDGANHTTMCEPGAIWISREQLVDALADIELHPVLLDGRSKGVVVAEQMADAILACIAERAS